jgi:hypothetical protein
MRALPYVVSSCGWCLLSPLRGMEMWQSSPRFHDLTRLDLDILWYSDIFAGPILQGQQLRWQAVQRFSLGDQEVGCNCNLMMLHWRLWDCCMILCLETFFPCLVVRHHFIGWLSACLFHHTSSVSLGGIWNLVRECTLLDIQWHPETSSDRCERTCNDPVDCVFGEWGPAATIMAASLHKASLRLFPGEWMGECLSPTDQRRRLQVQEVQVCTSVQVLSRKTS